MLHLIGKPYIMQHCIIASRREQLDISYRAYMTDALANLIGAEERWYDMVAGLVENRPQTPQPSADEVIARIKNGLNGGDEA
jgi:hypothetical protein|nr:MAG TPA: hypothetical protein [Caudoviricetes sp.]